MWEKAQKQKGDLLDNAIRQNVFLAVEELKDSEPIIKKLYDNGKIEIIGGYYHLDSGKVDFIKEQR